MAGNLADVITCAKFQDEMYRGYDFKGGRISHFPIDFRMGLTTVQRDCAACDKQKRLFIYLKLFSKFFLALRTSALAALHANFIAG